jgi:hypothetical protein
LGVLIYTSPGKQKWDMYVMCFHLSPYIEVGFRNVHEEILMWFGENLVRKRVSDVIACGESWSCSAMITRLSKIWAAASIL